MPREPAIKPARRDAKRPLALPSTASRMRSRFGTKAFFSYSSRSSRAFSSRRNGSRASAQRSVGGIAMVVINAIATIIVNRFWLNSPIASPMVATMTSVEPRAFMPIASAVDSRPVSPPNQPPANAPTALPRLAIAMRPKVSSASSLSLSTVRSALKPARPKNTGMNSPATIPRNWRSISSVRIGDSPTRMPATKAPSTVWTPISCVISANTPMITNIAAMTGASPRK